MSSTQHIDIAQQDAECKMQTIMEVELQRRRYNRDNCRIFMEIESMFSRKLNFLVVTMGIY